MDPDAEEPHLNGPGWGSRCECAEQASPCARCAAAASEVRSAAAPGALPSGAEPEEPVRTDRSAIGGGRLSVPVEAAAEPEGGALELDGAPAEVDAAAVVYEGDVTERDGDAFELDLEERGSEQTHEPFGWRDPWPELEPIELSAEESPEALAGGAQGFGPSERADVPRRPAPRPEYRRLVSLGLVALLIWAYVSVGGGVAHSVSARALGAAGALHPGLLERAPEEGWRLLYGSFVHSSFLVLSASLFLVWLLGGEAERRAGAGLVLTVVVGLGSLLNVARTVLESATSLHVLAGAWPVGFALGGAALVLVRRHGSGGARRVISLLVFETALVSFVAYLGHLLGPGLAAVIGLSLVAGALLGAVWPLGAARPVAGSIALMGCALAVWLAEATRRQQVVDDLPAPWEVSSSRLDVQTLGAVEPHTLEGLGLSVELPEGWREHPLRARARCPGCQEQLEVPEGVAAGASFPCPSCAADVPVRKQPTREVLYVERALFGAPRRIAILSVPKGPFDAPDTLAERMIAELGGPDPWLAGARLLEDRFVENEALGRGYMVSLRGRLGTTEVLDRLYFFVGAERTVRVHALSPGGDELDPAAEAALFDAIVRTLRPLPREGSREVPPGG